jgi:hypothetical protein
MSPPKRDEPQFFNAFAIDRRPIDGPQAIDGLVGACLSWDPGHDASTFVIEVPPGFRREHGGSGGMLEFFVLRGDLALEGDRTGGGGYVHLPQGGGGGELESSEGATAIAFWNPAAPAFPPPFSMNRVTRLYDEPWVVAPGVHGSMHKALRLPDITAGGMEGGPGGYLRIEFIGAGMVDPAEHIHHECYEEVLMLQGDLMLADEGILGLGSFIGHPQEWWHGPLASRTGALFILHTDAPMAKPWEIRDYPVGDELVNTYLDTAPWDSQAEHAPWSETGLAAVQDDSGFQQWARTAPEYATTIGRNGVARFRHGTGAS